MKKKDYRIWVGLILFSLVVPLGVQGQSLDGVPRTIRFSGALTDAAGAALTGAQGVSFALYAEQTAEAPLWLETQNVTADDQGRYSVLLGSMREDGLPQDVFTSNEARWLGVQSNQPDSVEQPRVLLVSVPYALKAADAETLGGKPVTAFLLAPSADGDGSTSDAATSEATATDGLPTASVAVANRLVKYTDGAGTMDSSNVTDDGANVGIGSPSTGAKLHIAGSVPGTGITDLLSMSTTDGVVRSGVSARGLQFWRFNNGVSDVGQMAFATPGGSPGIVMWTGPTFDQNRFDIVNYGSQFSLGFSADAGGTGQVLNLKPGGNIGIGTAAPTQKLDVASGNIKITGTPGVHGYIFADATKQTTAASANVNIRGINFIAGCDTCSLLGIGDDQKTIYQDVIGNMNITQVTCFADTGSPTIKLQRDDGSPLDILAAALTCNGTPTALFNGTENQLVSGNKIDFDLFTTTTSHRVTVVIQAVVQ